MPSTTRYKRGDIVLAMQDVVLAAITSQGAEDSALTIEPGDCVDGILPKTSVVKPAKLFTIHSTLVLKKICALGPEKLSVILTEIRQFFS